MPLSQKLTLNQFESELAFAFQRDCENLLEKFEKLETYSYSEFAKLWKEMSFTLVFSVHEYYIFVHSFVENCFFMIKKFLMFPRSVYVQVGAFYLLYGAFYKQPVDKWVKIRIIPDELKQINSFIELMKEGMHKDVLFVFAKLLNDDAFSLVATLTPKGTEENQKKSFNAYSNDTFQQKMSESALQKFDELYIIEDVFKQLDDVDKEYMNAKAQCPEACRGFFKDELDLTPIATRIYNKIHHLVSENPTETSDADDEDQPDQSILSRREKIRRKAFASRPRKPCDSMLHRNRRKTKKSLLPRDDVDDEFVDIEEYMVDIEDLETKPKFNVEDININAEGN